MAVAYTDFYARTHNPIKSKIQGLIDTFLRGGWVTPLPGIVDMQSALSVLNIVDPSS